MKSRNFFKICFQNASSKHEQNGPILVLCLFFAKNTLRGLEKFPRIHDSTNKSPKNFWHKTNFWAKGDGEEKIFLYPEDEGIGLLLGTYKTINQSFKISVI